jgi:hypothetical protein
MDNKTAGPMCDEQSLLNNRQENKGDAMRPMSILQAQKTFLALISL